MIASTYLDTTENASTMQFENVNEGRSYPFSDDANLVSDSGDILPEELITDLHLVIPTEYDAVLSSVYLSNNMISCCIKVFKGTTSTMALSVTVMTSDLKPYIPYRLEKLTGSEDIGGVITFGDITPNTGPKTYRFSQGVSIIPSAVSHYTPSGLRKIVDDRTGESVSGDVKIEFSSYIKAEKSAEGIYLSLSSGANEELLPYCDRDRPVNACGATPIASINGVNPDSNNRIVLWFH